MAPPDRAVAPVAGGQTATAPGPSAAFGDEPEEPANTPIPRDPPYLAGLNPEQREAVLAVDGPVLVLAGAGTGKTPVLTTRLAHILATRRACPGQHLAVAYTHKPALTTK